MSGEAALWKSIADRLDRLAERHGPVGFWLRDDDATEPSVALDRLIGIAAGHRVPLALAVIPARATPALADRLAGLDGVSVLQHGFNHANHAGPDARKVELGASRSVAAVLADLADGRDRLAVFQAVRPVLVPPWNRIDPAVAEALPSLGFRGLSLFGERRGNPSAALTHLNAHLDPVAWRSGRGFMGREAALALLLARLDLLAAGEADPGEATGILTHHLVHDDETFTFLADLLRFVSESPACRWLSVEALLASCP